MGTNTMYAHRMGHAATTYTHTHRGKHCTCLMMVHTIMIMIIIMRQVMAYKCSYKLPIYMGKVYKGWKGHV